MDWKLVLEYIKTLIWPITTLTLGFVFRKQLSGLFGKIDSVETPIGGITFQRQVEAVAQEAAEIEGEIAAEVSEPSRQVDPATEENSDSGERIPSLPETRPDRYEREMASLLRIADSDPTAAVLGAWRELEIALTDVIPPSSIRYTPRAMIQRAEMQGVLPNSLARVAADLKVLRDRVVHEGDVSLTREGAASYIAATQSVLDALSLARTPMARGIRYEQAVLRTIIELGFNIQSAAQDGSHDFFVSIEDKRVGIVVRHRTRGPLMRLDIKRSAERIPASVIPTLMVTNVALSPSAIEAIPEITNPADTALREVVQWRDGQDDRSLVDALQRMATT
ncbi:hypothetical protein ACFU7X_25200 [Streptomyces chartreusis]|uniref:hypothetical protein n=1 Tax=Streptomyces chartreusis TaxID=1969 RepID=UPI0036C12041